MKKINMITKLGCIGLLILTGCGTSKQEEDSTESPKEILMNAIQKQETLNSYKNEIEYIYTNIDNDGGRINVYDDLKRNIVEMTMRKNEHIYLKQVDEINQMQMHRYYDKDGMMIACEVNKDQGVIKVIQENESDFTTRYQTYYQPVIEGDYKDYFSFEKEEKDGDTIISVSLTNEDGFWKKDEEITSAKYPEENPLALKGTNYIPSKRDIQTYELKFTIDQDGNLSDVLYELQIDYGDGIIDHQKIHEKISNINQDVFDIEKMEILFNQAKQGELAVNSTITLVK